MNKKSLEITLPEHSYILHKLLTHHTHNIMIETIHVVTTGLETVHVKINITY